jgi:predicted kinase
VAEFTLVIVNGPPGSGKSTLALRLADELQLPLLMRDGIKEVLFDTLGWRDRSWSIELGGASYELLFHFLECQLEAKKAAIVESPFYTGRHTPRFLALKEQHGFEPFQIFCSADAQVLWERFNRRATSDERHPGHVDHLGTRAQFMDTLSEGKVGVLGIGGALVELDTTADGWLEGERLRDIVGMVRAKLGTGHG